MPLPDPASLRNQILAMTPAPAYQRFRPHLQPVSLKFKQVLYEYMAEIDYVYFPVHGITSTLTIMQDGSAIEVATVGREGIVGLTALFGTSISPNKVIVQVAGDGFRMRADAFRAEAERNGPLRRLVLLYHTAFLTQISQTVACNGLHSVRQRCCRWLLMTHDRVQTTELGLTHEFLAVMLGVRRPSVSEVLGSLQKRGIIRSSRGKITILDRARLEAVACECYGAVASEFGRLFT